MTLDNALISKFHDSYIPVTESGCWIWMGAISVNHRYPDHSYGRINNYLAHRLSALLSGMSIDGMDVLHKCDVPVCVNPAHLFLGTQADNNRDMTLKGRNRSKNLTHCKHGHEFTPENSKFIQGGKRCLTCAKERRKRYVDQARSLGLTYGYTAISKPRYGAGQTSWPKGSNSPCVIP